MRSHRVFPVCLLSAGVLVLAACATSQPRGALLEKKFQQTAKYYDKYQHDYWMGRWGPDFRKKSGK